MTSLSSSKNNLNNFPENCFINELSSYSQANCSAAFSTRLLKANYTGPMVNVRRSSDNATQDFYGDINGILGTFLHGKGTALSNWLDGSTGFVTTWYDQSGYSGRDLIQATTTLQPIINSSGTTITYDGTKSLYNTTNTPLTSGLDTYTFICNFTATDYSNSRTIIEISPTTLTTGTRSGVMQFYTNYGFVGHSCDAFIINNNTSTNRKCVMMCNHNLSSNNIVINDNGTIYSGTTNAAPSNLSVVPTNLTIGRNTVNGEFFIGNINEIIVFTNTLTTRESEFYFTPNTVTRKNYYSFPKIQLKGVPKDNEPIPSGWRFGFDSQNFSNLASGNTVSSWSSFNSDSNHTTNSTITAVNSPIYRTANGKTTFAISQAPYIEFTTASSMHLNGGSRTFNSNTNGGFTAVCYCAFRTTGQSFERIFDFGNGTPSDNIMAYRQSTTSQLSFEFYNGTTSYFLTTTNSPIIQNEWAVYTFRHNTSSRFTEILKNGILIASNTAAVAMTNKTLTNTYVARSNWGSDAYASINIAGIYTFDRYLNDTQISSIANHLVYPTTINIPNVIPDYTKVNKVGYVQTIGYRQDQAMFFNGGIDSYINIQDIPALPLTYSFWFNCTNTTNNTIVGLCDFAKNGLGIQIDILNSNLTVYAALPSTWTSTTAYAVSANTWYHITIAINLSFQVLVYINGSLYQTLTGTAIPPARSRFVVGTSGDGGRGYYGYIYDFRVYDYVLRADEVSNIADMREKLQLTYTSPSNYIVNVRNWYDVMTLYKGGNYTAVKSANNPNVTYQLLSSGTSSSSNTFYHQTTIQNYSSFTCSFELYTSSATADALYFYCGSTVNTTTSGTGANNSYGVSFQVYNSITPGIYLYNNSGTVVAFSSINHWINLGMWVPVTITYTRGSINTWVINLNGTDIIKYSDSNNSSWLSSAGNYWGIGAWNGGATMNAFIRRVELTYTPNTYGLINTLNSSLKTYPTGAMTANTTVLSDGTYIASASNTAFGNPFHVFNNTFSSNGTTWYAGQLYNGTTGIYTGAVSTTVSGTAQLGEWIQIQLPTPIVINSYGLTPWWPNENYKPRSFILTGSNDGSTWVSLSDIPSKTNWIYGNEEIFTVNTTLSYNYYRLIFRRAGIIDSGGTSQDYVIIDSLRLFGYQNTNKFPITALTSNNTSIPGNTLGNGNYICRASTENGGTYLAYRAFINSYNDNIGWATNFSLYNTTTRAYLGSVSTTVSGSAYTGEWLQIQLPNAIQLASFNIHPRQDNYFISPSTFIMAGSNDGVIWNLVHTGSTTWSSVAEKSFICNAQNSNKYNYFRLICQTASGQTFTGFQNLSLFAANSLRSANGLLAYPPANLTANTTTLSGYSYGNGTYIASVSTAGSNNPFNVFDGANSTNYQLSNNYDVNTGVYTGSVTTTVSGVTQTGAWIQIQLPNKIQLSSCSITSFYGSFPYTPRSFVIAGSNDGSTWTSLYDTTNCNSWIPGIPIQNIQVNATIKYMYYRFINRRNGISDSLFGQDWWFMDNWILYDSGSQTPRGLIDGLTWKSYDGYHADSMTFTQTNTYRNIGTSIDFTNLESETMGYYFNGCGFDTFTIEWFGYFRANITGTWTFTITGTDDSSYVWIGSTALTGYTTTNQIAKQSSTTGTINMIAGVYYPIRILYGENGGGEVFAMTFTPPGGVPTYNGQGYFFSSTGLNSAYPAESAKVIKDLTGTNTDGTYYINVNGTSTGTYCLMNDMYDGGGWMMLMKATTGTTFGYSTNYWTTTNTLNPTDLTRNNADAKYNVFNYNHIKDVMAIWPDINPDSYTNMYGKNGGCFYVKDGWVWKVDNWNGATRTTALAGFQSSRKAGGGTDSVLQPNDINNPFRYSGFSYGLFSYQTGSYVHHFSTTTSSSNVRWGFVFNNETGDYNSIDSYGGIGMGGNVSYSAGDNSNGISSTVNINRSARIELYGR